MEQAYDFFTKIIASETCSDAASLRGFSLRYFFKITAPSPFFPFGQKCLCQGSNLLLIPKKKTTQRVAFSLASLRGFEPPTYRLGGGRSILLSYNDI